MRKLALACALAAAALFAQGARAESTQQKAKDDAGKVSGAARKTGQRWKEAGERAFGGSGGTASADVKAFDGKKNFDLDGKVAKVSKTSITISREDLPPATLGVAKDTKVQLDGDDASIRQLRPGQDVKASFNLDREHPEAVEIKAKRTDAEKQSMHRNANENAKANGSNTANTGNGPRPTGNSGSH